MSEPNPKKILYLGRTRIHRSQANLVQTLRTIEGWRNMDWEVDLHLPPWPKSLNLPQHLSDIGVNTTPRIFPHYLLHPRFHYRLWVHLHRSMLQAAPILYTRVVEISLTLARANIPHHLEIHDTKQILDQKQMDRLIQFHRAGNIQFLVPISQNAAQTLIRSGAHPDRIHVAPSGVDIDAFRHIPAFSPQHLQSPNILYLGRISPGTGLNIFSAIAAQTSLHVTLVGKQCSNLPINGSLHTHPFIPPKEIPHWYAKMDIALLPYQRELDTVDSMSPVKLFESMAAGRPIIASDLPTLREVIHHGENGLLVEPHNPQAWIDAIELLRANPQLAEKIAANAKKDATQYSWNQRAAGILGKIAPPASRSLNTVR